MRDLNQTVLCLCTCQSSSKEALPVGSLCKQIAVNFSDSLVSVISLFLEAERLLGKPEEPNRRRRVRAQRDKITGWAMEGWFDLFGDEATEQKSLLCKERQEIQHGDYLGFLFQFYLSESGLTFSSKLSFFFLSFCFLLLFLLFWPDQGEKEYSSKARLAEYSFFHLNTHSQCNNFKSENITKTVRCIIRWCLKVFFSWIPSFSFQLCSCRWPPSAKNVLLLHS